MRGSSASRIEAAGHCKFSAWNPNNADNSRAMRSRNNRPTAATEYEDRLLEYLDGHIDLGQKREVLRLCTRVLAQRRVSSEAVWSVVRAVGMYGTRRGWAAKLEACYAWQPAKICRSLDGSMVLFYGGFGDWPNAARFAGVRKNWQPHEAAFVMEALLDAGRIDEARRLHSICFRDWCELYSHATNGPMIGDAAETERFFFRHTMALYEARTGGCSSAALLWSHCPDDHPLVTTAMRNCLDAYLCCALGAANDGIKLVERLSRDDPSMLELPCNHDREMAQHLRDLQRCRRTLERLVTPERRKEFGLPNSQP